MLVLLKHHVGMVEGLLVFVEEEQGVADVTTEVNGATMDHLRHEQQIQSMIVLG